MKRDIRALTHWFHTCALHGAIGVMCIGTSGCATYSTWNLEKETEPYPKEYHAVYFKDGALLMEFTPFSWSAAGDLKEKRWWARLQLDRTQVQNRATEYEIHHSPIPAKEIQNATAVPIQRLEKLISMDPKTEIPHMEAYRYIVNHTTTSTPQFWLKTNHRVHSHEIFISFLTDDTKHSVRVLTPTSEPGGRQSTPSSEYVRAVATTPFAAAFDAATLPVQVPVIIMVFNALENVH